MKPKYKRMLEGMQRKADAEETVEPWFLYILKCFDGTLYTGVTKDIERRLKMHNAGKASKYTRTRRPVELVYQEPCDNRAQALVRECAVKALSRQAKQKLIEI